MITNQIEKALRLAKKTKDKIIVIDSANPDNSFVILGFDDYEKMIDETANISHLTEEQMLDKINRDIDQWKNDNKDESQVDNLDTHEVDLSENIEDDKLYYYDEPEKKNYISESSNEPSEEELNSSMESGIKKSKSSWRIPSNIKEAAEEVVEDIPF